MGWRILGALWALGATAAAVWFAVGGTVPAGELLDGIAGVALLLALWGVISLPWDLYFAARAVLLAQEDGAARAVNVRPEERAEAAKLARRLLSTALGLHVVGAVACAAMSFASGGVVGWFASGAFLLSMGLRPAWAMVGHVRRRLAVLQGRAVLPPLDAQWLAGELQTLKDRVEELRRTVEDGEHGLSAIGTRVETGLDGCRRRADNQERHHQAELDRLGLEMQRALEKLTRDQEVLSGLRAFLQMVRER